MEFASFTELQEYSPNGTFEEGTARSITAGILWNPFELRKDPSQVRRFERILGWELIRIIQIVNSRAWERRRPRRHFYPSRLGRQISRRGMLYADEDVGVPRSPLEAWVSRMSTNWPKKQCQ